VHTTLSSLGDTATLLTFCTCTSRGWDWEGGEGGRSRVD
jgi:hypothetical protein